MERCVIYIVFWQTITRNRLGFTRGDSAINFTSLTIYDFGRALDNGKKIRVVFCDTSQAFDRVWHEGLLFNLETYGISGNLLNWINSKREKVKLEGR